MKGYYKSVVQMKKKLLKMKKKMILKYMMMNTKNKIMITIAMKMMREANRVMKTISFITFNSEIQKPRITLVIRLRVTNQLNYLMR